MLEAVKLADEVGLDYFGVGEHHMAAMPLSSPTSVVNAAAASTRRIKLLRAVNAQENLTWNGPHRTRPLNGVTVFPGPSSLCHPPAPTAPRPSDPAGWISRVTASR